LGTTGVGFLLAVVLVAVDLLEVDLLAVVFLAVDFGAADLGAVDLLLVGLDACTVAPADEDADEVLVVVQMLPLAPLGVEPGHPQDQFRSTMLLMPATRPASLYCQNDQAFQPPGSGTGWAAVVWLAIHSGYWANFVVSEMKLVQ